MRNARRDARGAALAAIPAALGVIVACAVNPVTGKRELSLVSAAREVQIGKESDPAVRAEYGAYSDSALQRYVDGVGQRLAAASHRPDLDWHFLVLDSPVVNAFALPGGYIYITRGILAHLNSEAQLAGVLGHEIGHVTARHGAQQVTRQQLAGGGLLLASVLVSGFQRYGDLAQQGLGLLFLKYGRDDENQADELGVGYATRAGFDPREIPATYSMLRRISERGGQRLPTFLSTHPDPGDRERRTRALAEQAVQGAGGTLAVGEADYKQRIEGMVWGDDPREGYFVEQRFYQPELKLQVDFPTGWRTQNERSRVVAVAPDEQGVVQLGVAQAEESTSPGQHVAALRGQGRIVDAVGGTEQVGGMDAWVGTVIAPRSDGTRMELLAAFIRYPQGPLYELLGRDATPQRGHTAAILAAMRSFDRLTDAPHLDVRPARVDVVAVAQAAPLGEVLAGLGALAADAGQTAVLNNLAEGEPVQKGYRLKVARRGRWPGQ